MLSDEEIVLKRLKETLDVLKGKNVIGRLDFQIRDMVEDCIRVIEKQSKEIEELKEENENLLDALNNSIDIRKYWVSKDKIKAKIEPVLKQLDTKMKEEYNKYGNSREYQDIIDAYNFLQSLLEKE